MSTLSARIPKTATWAPHSLGVLEAIDARRAVRAYETGTLDEATVRALLEAAVRAPTAMHLEPWAFVVVQDRDLLRRTSDRVKAGWLARVAGEKMHVAATVPARSSFLRELSDPAFNVFYDAGTLLVICAKPMGEFVVADCWLAAENLMLTACALGLGTCVIGSAVAALNAPELKRELAIPPDVIAVAPIIVGVPRSPTVGTSRRPPEVLSWVRSVESAPHASPSVEKR